MQMIWLVSEILLQGQAAGPSQGPWAWHYGMMGGGWGIFFMVLFMALFWGLIIAGIVFLVRFISPSSDGQSSPKALETLKNRYAKGEITKEQFESMKRDIG
ncbi:MAG: SHOCT domain-containing protein [Candidatus Binatia bacterium]